MAVIGGIVAMASASAPARRAPTPASTLTSSLANARIAHTATLLDDGRVLVVGGGIGPDLIDGFWVVSQAEVFDPDSSRFVPAGASSHDMHTATLLQSGQVLIAGGESDGFVPTAAADVYDPETGVFHSTGAMAAVRESHTATLLADGRVLVAGGAQLVGIDWVAINGAELYDPRTGTFSPTGGMSEGRYGHTATLLADGRVLVTGGWNRRRLGSAEIYDPATGRFAPAGSMTLERSFHAATLLATGQVLVTGGQPRGAVFGEIYDPATDAFTATGSMATPRMWHTSTLMPDGTVLVVGGWASGSALSSVEIYDPATGVFAPTDSLAVPRLWHTATLMPDGSLLIIGGASGGLWLDVLASAEVLAAGHATSLMASPWPATP
jgi:hypothetical protein